MDWYWRGVTTCHDFNSRNSRREYWMFFLSTIFVSAMLAISVEVLRKTVELDLHVLTIVYSFAMVIPCLAATVRRIHDTGHSGWWVLIPVYNLLLLCWKSEEGGNRYGASPITAPQSSARQEEKRLAA
jgi:uncharacterized membrane protein YhaH (DUF805 family)